MSRFAWFVILLLVAANSSSAQLVSTALPTFFFPRSTQTFGFGFQGSATASGLASLQYNPSHSAFLTSATLEAGKFGGFPTFASGYRLTWLRAGVPFDFGSFAVEYHRFSFGEFTVIDMTTLAEKKTSPFEEGISLSFGKHLSDNFVVGGGIRYGRSVFDYVAEKYVASQFMFSAGITWMDEVFGRDFRVGFSMLDFGPTTKTTYTGPVPSPQLQSDPVPAEVRLGFEAEAFASSVHELTFGLELSRRIADRDMTTGEARSSFRSLFTHWKDFPRDVNVHTGIRYEFLPVVISSGWGIRQVITMGVFDDGFGGRNWMTAGWGISVGTPVVDLEVTTASIWHYLHEIPLFFGGTMPSEQLQISMKLPHGQFEGSSALPNLRVSGGFELARPAGRFRDWYASNGQQYSIEAAFYTSQSFALVSAFSLSTFPFSGFFGFVEGDHIFFTSTISARTHPFDPLVPFYLQAGIFLTRWKPSFDDPQVTISPAYRYNPGIAFEAGYPIELEFIVLTPIVSVRSLFGPIADGGTGGYIDWTYGLRIGTDL
ncbi:MAG TPA: hypothetical protein VJB38_06635 [Bacteroidota bacterium]|nr:hypothetical protein [Bacteroidota bacterium]